MRTKEISLTLNNALNPAKNYMFKVNNRNTRARCEICSELTIKTLERCQWGCSDVFIVNSEHVLTPCSSVTIFKFEQVNAGWGMLIFYFQKYHFY